MKKLFLSLIILIIAYIGLQILFNFFKSGQTTIYNLKNNDIIFSITETSNFKNDNSNYLFEIDFNDKNISFQVDYNFKKKSNIIKKIEYYKDENNECILPIFKKDLVLVDMICYDKELTYYYNLKGKNPSLDHFANSIYDTSIIGEDLNYETIDKFHIYKSNLIKDHYIGITSYKGIYRLGEKVDTVNLFANDIYNQKLGIFVNNYYVVADYNQKHQFNEFIMIDLLTLKTYKIKSDTAISIDSYIQGVILDNIYLYDKDNKVQYIINTDKKTIKRTKKIKYYNSGEWTNISISEANNEVRFIYDKVEYENNNYERIDKVGSLTGYYYLYMKNNNKYDVYRINIQNNKGLMYLFTIDNINNIYYIDDYIYFIENSNIKVFNSRFGLKTLIEYNELEFNKNINFTIYLK